MNGLERLTTNSRSLNTSKVAPESLCCWKRFSFPGSSLLGYRNLRGRQSLRWNVSGWCYHVCSSSKLYMIPYTVLQMLRHNFL